MSRGVDVASKWAERLVAAGAPERTVAAWRALRTAITSHQGLLRDEGIGVEVSERERVRVNARRVGLQAPLFADETDFAEALRQETGGADGQGARGSSGVSKDEATHADDVARAVARSCSKDS